MEVVFFTPNVAFFCVCVTLSRYMKIGQNLLNERVEKTILADFDQFIILVNKWKAKWVHEDIHGSKKPPKRP